MKSRLNHIPILKSLPTYIDASCYNNVRIALGRLANPMRLELLNLRGLDIVIDDEAWVCVDRGVNDLPILAWTDFQMRNRQSLQESVPCQLKFFHSHADLICGNVLDIVYRHVTIRLNRLRKTYTEPSKVCYIRSFR